MEAIVFLFVVYFILFCVAFFFLVVKEWSRATYAVWAIIFIPMLLPSLSPWEKTGILPNLIFLLVWSWGLYLFAKEKKRSAFLASLLTLGTTIILVVLFRPHP